MTVKEQIMKLQTYKMYEGEDTVYVERNDVLKALEQQSCDDYISRAKLLSRIDAERKHLLDLNMDGAEHVIVHHARRIIEDMPSVTPQQPCEEENPNCTECRYYDKEKHHCPRFCKVIENTMAEITSEQERPKGKWSRPSVVAMPYSFAYECPICRQWGNIQTFKPNYCPNCGADMRGEEE